MQDSRRVFSLCVLLATLGACALGKEPTVSVSILPTPPTDSTNAFYVANRPPLEPSPWARLPIGAIRPRGWILTQLRLMADGYTGRLTELSPWCKADGNAWMSPEGTGHSHWEELPYWLKGFGDLGYILQDERILEETERWIEAVLASQEPDGWFGPRKNKEGPDLWPNMIMLNVLQSRYEATGDERVIPFMLRYFRWENSLPTESLLRNSWQKVRGGDNLESVYWLYNRTGEPFLLELARKIHKQTVDWTGGIASWHGVNISQGFREPAEYFMQTGDPRYLQATIDNYDTVMTLYGQVPGGMFGADENCRRGFDDPRQAAESCSMVEFMHSFEMLTRITGNPVWADRCEDVAFNSFPASMPPDLKGLHYLTAPNMVQLDALNKAPGLQNSGCMLRYDPHMYRCCQHNTSHGWPYFAEELWLASPGNGLGVSLYGPCEVEARVGAGAAVRIVEETEYPFGDRIVLRVAALSKPADFPLYLRIPGWCPNASVRINGEPLDVSPAAGSYLRIQRRWKQGDEVALTLPMKVRIRRWEKNHHAVSVDYGPLTFSLKIRERWVKIDHEDGWPGYDVFPDSPWNYGLVIDEKDPAAGFEIVRRNPPDGEQPFSLENAPLEIRARARRIPQWQLDPRGLVGELQDSPAYTTEPEETITLVPMGCARLRIAAFPVASTSPDAVHWNPPPEPPFKAEASHCWPGDTPFAMNDGIEPLNSADRELPRMTWWNHRGTKEWAGYRFDEPRRISWVAVYWFDDGKHGGGCRIPASWRLLYRDGEEWKPVSSASGYGVEADRYNRVTFDPVETTGLRIEVQLQPGYSAGILEWKVGNDDPS